MLYFSGMEYITHLQKDKKLLPVLTYTLQPLQVRNNIPLRLMASIMSQQLSTKVARIIYHRFLALYNGQEPQPEQVLATDPLVLRGIGLSHAKVSYVHNVARFCLEQAIDDEALLHRSNEEIITLLTQIKGVGQWTVEMLLMFALGREDVFAADDLGVQQGMIKLYNIQAADKKTLKEKMLKISARWKPYRTYACMHLWQWKDNVPEP